MRNLQQEISRSIVWLTGREVLAFLKATAESKVRARSWEMSGRRKKPPDGRTAGVTLEITVPGALLGLDGMGKKVSNNLIMFCGI